MEDIRHECLESHVFHSRDVFCSCEVIRGTICSTLASIVHHYLVLAGKQSTHSREYFGCHTVLDYESVQVQKRLNHEVYLCHFTKSSPFLSEVDNYSASSALRFFYCFFYAEDEVGSASANIGPKDITSVALNNNQHLIICLQSPRETVGIPHRGFGEKDERIRLTFCLDLRSSRQ